MASIRAFFLLLALSQSLGKDYYDLLGLPRNVDQKAIRQAFKKIAVTYHPDKNSDDPEAHVKFLEFTKAYEVLKDPELRKKYDIHGEEGLNGANTYQQNYHSYSYYQNNFGIYDDDPQVVTLNSNDFDENVINSEKMWIINFYSPMCTHCHQLAPTWRQVAKDLEGVIRVGAVNCEDDWPLCQQLGIRSYPTLLYYPKNSRHGLRYTEEKSRETITEFVMSRLDINIETISKSKSTKLFNNPDQNLEKPMLIFACGSNRDCYTDNERLKVAAVLDNIITTGIVNCNSMNCDDLLPLATSVIFISPKNSDGTSKNDPIFFDDVEDADNLIQKILEILPEPQDITADDFEAIKQRLERQIESGWLICFYIGHATELDLQLKRLPSIIHDVNLGKVNCGRYSHLCNNLNINRYPMWGVLKPGGAFELSHGKSTINDIAKFAENSIKAENVWALSADKILSILKRKNGGEVWFVDWYAPWCPPCMQFFPELRKASLEFEKSTVYFGTVDCTVHSSICRQYNIRSYPTAMLINGSITSQFTMQKTAAHIVEFINEAINPTVIRLNSDNFHHTLGKKRDKVMWVVDYFAPWCGPCQQLAPEWTAVAKVMHILPNVKIASVDCEADADLCRAQGIRSYPTIRMYPFDSMGLSEVVMFNGHRNSATLLRWMGQFLPVKVKELTDESLQRTVLQGRKAIWLVDYYAPWCGHCQTLEPHFVVAAQLFQKHKVHFARLNCDVYRSACANAGIRAYPTLILYTGKSRETKISAFTAEDIKNEVFKLVKITNNHDEL